MGYSALLARRALVPGAARSATVSIAPSLRLGLFLYGVIFSIGQVATVKSVAMRPPYLKAKRNAVNNSLHKTCNDLAVTLTRRPARQYLLARANKRHAPIAFLTQRDEARPADLAAGLVSP
jgi:hypothetical protein